MITYTIQKGQTLPDAIMQATGTLESAMDIAAYNGLPISHVVAAGDVLNIPTGVAVNKQVVEDFVKHEIVAGNAIVYTAGYGLDGVMGLTVTGTTLNSITATWAVSSVFAYEYAYNTSGAEPVTDITTTALTSVTITGLFSTTSYYVFVRCVDNEGNKSEWASVRATTAAAPPAVLLELPTYPFAVSALEMGMYGVAISTRAFIIDDLTGLNAFIDRMNTVLVPHYGLTGSYAVVDNAIQYNNGPGESFVLEAMPRVFTDYLSFVMDSQHPYYNVAHFSLYAPASAWQAIIDYGDGSDVEFKFGIWNIDHAYPGGAETVNDANLRIFHSGANLDPELAITSIQRTTGDNCPIKKILPGSTAPAGLTVLRLHYSFAYPGLTYDAGFLIPCKDTLTTMEVFSTNATEFTFSHNIFDVFAGSGAKFGPQFNHVVVGGVMTTASVSGVIEQLYANHNPGIPPGTLVFLSNNGDAPPDATALAILNTYSTTYGYSVFHD